MRSPVAPNNPQGDINETGNEGDTVAQSFGLPIRIGGERLFSARMVGSVEPDHYDLVERNERERRG